MPQHREHQRTGYPSEPVVAMAAMTLLDQYEEFLKEPGSNGLINILSMLQTKKASAIDMGQQGENVGKIFIISA